jgi:hypothetical protein
MPVVYLLIITTFSVVKYWDFYIKVIEIGKVVKVSIIGYLVVL